MLLEEELSSYRENLKKIVNIILFIAKETIRLIIWLNQFIIQMTLFLFKNLFFLLIVCNNIV